MEDTHMFMNGAGYFHALFHTWDQTNVGGHAFSRDGISWTLSNTTAYTNHVETIGGNEIVYGRRERPHVVLDDEGNPTHLITGVTYPPADFSFTHVQGIGE